MGRKAKVLSEKIVDDEYIDKRLVGYYSTPDFISEYIKDRLIEIKGDGKELLDPCCGREEMILPFLREDIKSDGIDLIRCKNEYSCNFLNTDFIKFYYDKINEGNNFNGLKYDYYILNPPYNCHEVEYIRKNKDILRHVFNDVGTSNMYSMFISAVIDLAKDGAVIGIITQDSFLSSKTYKKLRKKILEKCSIHEITMCPTDLFLKQGADVRTSILILQKGLDYQRNIKINNRCLSTKDFKNKLLDSDKQLYSLNEVILDSKKDNNEFIIECPSDIKELFNLPRVDDKFKCISGISTGNDKKYLSSEKIEPFVVPFYKNPGKDKFFTNKEMYLDRNFLEFEKNTPNFIVRNKEYLYKSGVICSSMGVQFTACVLPINSTFGVNSCILCDEEDTYWILAYLNSNLVTYMVRGVLIRSNMITSGYVSRIPVLSFSKEIKDKLSSLGKNAYLYSKENKDIKLFLKDINRIINKEAKLSDKSILYINEFKKELVRLT